MSEKSTNAQFAESLRIAADLVASSRASGEMPKLAESMRRAADTIELLEAQLAAYEDAEEQGLLVKLPCKVGDTVYVIDKCEHVHMNRDDDYFTGTGSIECPFENTCDVEECDDSHIRVFETTVTDFWYGKENLKCLEVSLEHMGCGYTREDFGKTVFLTREEAEAALRKRKGGGEDA